MRSAEHLVHFAVAALLCAGLGGCASLPEPMSEPTVGSTTGSTGAPAAAAPAAPDAAVPRAEAATQEALAPAVRKAFDDAVRALRAGRVAEAERGFHALAQAHPGLGGPHANLGLIHRQAGRLAEAAAELELAVKASPLQPQFHNQLGIVYRQQGRFAQAGEAYEKAIALDANYAAAVLNLGVLSDLYLGDGPRALALYTRYLALTPAGDAAVNKWIADLKNRKAPPAPAERKEKE